MIMRETRKEQLNWNKKYARSIYNGESFHCEFLKFGILSTLFQYLSVTLSFRKTNDTDGDKDRFVDTKYLHHLL